MSVHASDFKPGLILVRAIAGSPLGYHYGVWVTVDEVIHASKTKHIVVCDTLEEFSAGLDVDVSDWYSVLCKCAPELVVERARAEVGKWPYELMDGNCEAFVHWCITGEKFSGLQMGAVKLVKDVVDALWLAPARAARERIEARRGVERQIAQIVDLYAKEDEEAHREMENAVAISRAHKEVLVTDESSLEELVSRHGEYYAILHRWRERRTRRNGQYVEMFKVALAHGEARMLAPLLEADQRNVQASKALRTSLEEAATKLHTGIHRHLQGGA